MLEFQALEFVGIGGKSSLRDRQGGTLILEFRDNENDHTKRVEMHVLLPKGPGVTMTELEEAARNEAKAILGASLDLLQGSSVAELLTREYQQEEADERARDEELQQKVERDW